MAGLKMVIKVAVLLMLTGHFAQCRGYDLVFDKPPDVLWTEMEREIQQEEEAAKVLPKQQKIGHFVDPGTQLEALDLPESVPISAASDKTYLFKPERGSRTRLPDFMRDILLPTVDPIITLPPLRPKLIEILCHIDRIYVRLWKDQFHSPDAYKYIKFGTCPVNQATETHYYLLYLLGSCGIKIMSYADHVTFTNSLTFTPVTTGPIVREMPFDLSLVCRYNRFQLSYKVGFMPTLMGGTVYLPLSSELDITLTPYDASWNELEAGSSYVIGQPMFFEAKFIPSGAMTFVAERIYVNKCFVTASHEPNSMPKYTVIDNSGCMVDGKFSTQSMFLTCTTLTTLRFTIGAFVFSGMASSSAPKTLYMHCEISKGIAIPTESAKSCNYNPTSDTWSELYSDSAVCSCCDAICPSVHRESRMVTSHSWDVDLGTTHIGESVPEHKGFVQETHADFGKKRVGETVREYKGFVPKSHVDLGKKSIGETVPDYKESEPDMPDSYAYDDFLDLWDKDQ